MIKKFYHTHPCGLSKLPSSPITASKTNILYHHHNYHIIISSLYPDSEPIHPCDCIWITL